MYEMRKHDSIYTYMCVAENTSDIFLREKVTGSQSEGFCVRRFTLMLVNISSRHLLSPEGQALSPPLCLTDGTLRHWVCFPKPHRAIAIQGKPSVHWHSFEHASHTTSHGSDQENVDFSQSLHSSLLGLDLIGRGLLYSLCYITIFSGPAL